MSTEIYSTDNFSLTNYWGGVDKGNCLQITMKDFGRSASQNLTGAVQLDLSDAAELYNQLGEWIKGECIRRQELLREEIEGKRELQKTIFSEIANLDDALIGNNNKLAVGLIDKFTPTHKHNFGVD